MRAGVDSLPAAVTGLDVTPDVAFGRVPDSSIVGTMPVLDRSVPCQRTPEQREIVRR